MAQRGAQSGTKGPHPRTTQTMNQPRSTQQTGTTQKVANVQNTPRNPNQGNLGMSEHQRIASSPQTKSPRQVSGNSGEGRMRNSRNTMAGKTGNRGE